MSDETAYKDPVIDEMSLLLKFQKWLNDAEQSQTETEWRQDALEDYRFYAGDQDTLEVKQILEDQNRPDTTFNEIKPRTDMLIGLAAQQKHAYMAKAIGLEDEPLAEMMTGAIDHQRRNIELGELELECFEHTVKVGKSFLYFYVDQSNPFELSIKAERLSSFSVHVDPKSVKLDLSDARYIIFEKWLSEDEVKALDPSLSLTELQQIQATIPDRPEYYSEVLDMYRFWEVWYWQWEEVVNFRNPLNGQIEQLNRKDFRTFKNMLAKGFQVGPDPSQRVQYNGPIEAHISTKKFPYTAIFTGTKVISNGKSPYKLDRWPIVQCVAYKNEDTNSWFGAVRMMKDPQRALNTIRRQLTHQLQTLPKGILVHETGAVLNIEEYEQRSSEPNFHLEVMAGKLGAIMFQQQPQISPVYGQLDQVYSSAIKDVSGVQADLMGEQLTSREPGVTVKARMETGLAVLTILYNNYRRFRKYVNEFLMAMIQQYVTMPMIIRQQGINGEKLIQINSQKNPTMTGFDDISAGKFDLSLEDVGETATQRAAIMQLLVDYNHNSPGSVPPDLILEYADVPYTVKERMREHAAQQAQAAKEQADREYELRKLEILSKLQGTGAKLQDVNNKVEIARMNVEAADKRQQKQAANKPKPKAKKG